MLKWKFEKSGSGTNFIITEVTNGVWIVTAICEFSLMSHVCLVWIESNWIGIVLAECELLIKSDQIQYKKLHSFPFKGFGLTLKCDLWCNFKSKGFSLKSVSTCGSRLEFFTNANGFNFTERNSAFHEAFFAGIGMLEFLMLMLMSPMSASWCEN